MCVTYWEWTEVELLLPPYWCTEKKWRKFACLFLVPLGYLLIKDGPTLFTVLLKNRPCWPWQHSWHVTSSILVVLWLYHRNVGLHRWVSWFLCVSVDKHVQYWTHSLLRLFIAQDRSRQLMFMYQSIPRMIELLTFCYHNFEPAGSFSLMSCCSLHTREDTFVCWFLCFLAIMMCKCHSFCPVDSHPNKRLD